MSKRNVGEEILESVRAIKRGEGRRIEVQEPDVRAVREKSGLSQSSCGALLGVSAFERPAWNLNKDLAWIRFRNRAWLAYEELDGFEGIKADSYTLLTDAHCRDMEELRAKLQEVRTVDQARGDLWDALEAGRLTARGIKNGEGEPADVPVRDWPYLRFQGYPPRAMGNGWDWRSLSFERGRVLEL